MSSLSAQRNLVLKLRLERAFIPILRRVFREIIAEFFSQYTALGTVVNARSFENLMRRRMLEHYDKVIKRFRRSFRDESGNKKTFGAIETKTADQTLDEELETIKNKLALSAVSAIMTTTQNDINRVLSASEATLTTVESDNPMPLPTRDEIAKLASVGLLARSLGRSNTIAATETQKMAESTRHAEINVLNQDADFIGAAGGVIILKNWVDLDDGKVRKTHTVAGNTQRNIPANVPFTVGGFQMMVPGDPTLGAPLKETIRCRCSAEYEAVFNENQ